VFAVVPCLDLGDPGGQPFRPLQPEDLLPDQNPVRTSNSLQILPVHPAVSPSGEPDHRALSVRDRPLDRPDTRMTKSSMMVGRNGSLPVSTTWFDSSLSFRFTC